MKKTMLVTMLMAILACGIVSALPTVDWVKINEDEFDFADATDQVLHVERGEDLDIRVKLSADQEEEDVEIAADILGYEYNDFARISDSTALFDMDENDTKIERLNIRIPENADKDKYDLRIRVAGRRGPAEEARVALNVKGARHQVQIRDVIFSPETNVQAGRAMLTTVRIKNYGEKDEEGIKIRVSIPGIGVSASDYIDELDEGDSTTSEELFLRIPNCAEPGVYEVVVTVTFDEGFESDSAETSILVTEGELCKPAAGPTQPTVSTPQTIISVGATTQDAAVGTGVVYPVTITNSGSTARTYTIVAEGTQDWADVSISPGTTFVVGAGQTQAAFVTVSAKPTAQPGQRMFSLTVSSGGEVLKQVPLTANVVAGQAVSLPWDRVKRGLEIGLVILVILLVILGLIIGFTKLKGNNEGEEKEKASYY